MHLRHLVVVARMHTTYTGSRNLVLHFLNGHRFVSFYLGGGPYGGVHFIGNRT